MAPPTCKLTLAPYLQAWDATRTVVSVRVMTVPIDDPRAPLSTGWAVPASPAFVDARLVLRAHVGTDAGRLPNLADVGPDAGGLPLAAAPHARSVFDAFAARFPVTKPQEAPERSAAQTMRKYLPRSYQSSHAFTQPKTRLAVTDDSYRCALRCPPSGPPIAVPPPPDLTWGEVFAIGMRKPQVARAMGFIHDLELDVGSRLRDGGWLFFTLDAASDFAPQVAADARFVKTFATRVPRLVPGEARPLFTPVLFPVAATAAAASALGNYDEIFREALRFDDGFARIVHARQPRTADVNAESTDDELRPLHEAGIQIGWDDEDILVSQNRSIGTDWDGAPLPEAPRGIFGYRVDIREAGTTAWASLCRVRSDGLRVGDAVVPAYETELRVEVHPSTVDGKPWLPPYFVRMRAPSLVASTPDQRLLLGRFDDSADIDLPEVSGVPDLRYGQRYELRVRLTDPTGGGPAPTDEELHEGEAPIASLRLQRFVPIGAVGVDAIAPAAGAQPTALRATRPTLGYPAAVWAGVPDAENRLAALARAAMAPGSTIEVGLPDPDARHLELQVLVRHPAFDAGNDDEGYRPLYVTHRSFPSDPAQRLDVALTWRDCARLSDVAWPGGTPPGTETGPLELPTGRDVVIIARAIADNDLVRLGSASVRLGEPVRFTAAPLYEAPAATPPLVTMSPADAVTSVYLLPEEARGADTKAAAVQARPTAELVRRLAQAAALSVDESTLFGAEGRRVVFGCHGLKHSLAPDRSSLALTALDELPGQWLNVVRFPIERDWSFLGLEAEAVRVARTIELVGGGGGPVTEVLAPVAVLHAVNRQATLGEVDRDRFEICYVDAFVPPLVGGLPYEVRLRYELTLRLRGGATQTYVVSNHLPVTTKPAQVPVVVSCGHAFSEYTIGDEYASTGVRQRALWIELDGPPVDSRDAYFVRAIASTPDPMLVPAYEPVSDPPPPGPAVPPEPIRVIRPGQADDFAGLGAMQRLIPAEGAGGRHYLVPLPANLGVDAPELFGFFTYEIVVGHDRGTAARPFWSTASARFGVPIVLDGVQHPPPPLRCAVSKTATGLRLFAEYATPVLDGRVVTPTPPHTELWGVLYGRVMQADGATMRNVELGLRRFALEPRPRKPSPKLALRTDRFARAICDVTRADLEAMLAAWGLPKETRVSALAVELLPEPSSPFSEPLSRELGNVRILRVSPLTDAGHDCC